MIVEDRIIKNISNMRGEHILDTPIYFGSLKTKELIDCMGEMEKYFEFECI